MFDSDESWPQKGDRAFIAYEDWRSKYNALIRNDWYYIAEGYRDGANIIAESVLNDRFKRDSLIYPIAFLYRHYFEIRLKEIILWAGKLLKENHDFNKNHDLSQLWNQARKLIEIIWPDGPIEDLINSETVIKEFSQIDPCSYAFRYPFGKKGQSLLKNDSIINIHNLAVVSNNVAALLDSIITGIQAMHDELD